MTASSHHAQQTYGMNVLYTAVSYPMHDTPHILLTCPYVRPRNHMYGIWHNTAVKNVC